MKSTNNYEGALSTLEVHLDRIAWNYLSLRKRLATGADCAAVVKANAYGLGELEVSRALYEQECRHFFTAHFDEAAAVRRSLPRDAVVYTLNGPYGASAKDFTALGIVPVLNTLDDIRYWFDHARQQPKNVPAVIHFDTGMNRLGLSAKEVAELVDQPGLLKPIDVRYVMSHLACADEPQHPMNAEQLKLFQNFTASLGRPLRYSLANSGGIFLGEGYHFDLVRPGCALYGINPTGLPENPMRGVITLKCRILQARNIDISTTVGYGAAYKVSPPANCVTVSVGYADGYLRSLTGKGAVFIGGVKCPVIGRVSMDSIIVDTTALKTQPVAGDWAEVIGEGQGVDDVAASAGTIGYEILTSLGKRYRRSYTGN
ncbi:MAG: alanine racemase [Alphaproteobacteria bacterium]